MGEEGKYKPATWVQSMHMLQPTQGLPVLKPRFPIWSKETKKFETWGSTECGDFEKDFFMCKETVGFQRMPEACPEIIHDFEECRFKRLTYLRHTAMDLERKRQGKAYVDVPAKDAVRPPTDLN